MSPPFKRVAQFLAVGLFSLTLTTGCASVPSSATPVPTSSGLTEEQLVQACIDATTSAFGSAVEFVVEDARLEPRTVEPEWLVLVPTVAETYNGEAQCTVGGEPGDVIVDMASASSEPLPETQIQNLIVGENEGGTQ